MLGKFEIILTFLIIYFSIDVTSPTSENIMQALSPVMGQSNVSAMDIVLVELKVDKFKLKFVR